MSHVEPVGPAAVRSPKDFLPLAVGLSWGAGFIHASAIPEHIGESWLHGAFFVVAATLQLIWGGLAYRSADMRVLRAGALGSLALAALWLVSRTVGTPEGFGGWETEAPGLLDVLATLDELTLAGLICLMLSDRKSLTTNRLLMSSIVVGMLLTASLVGPMLVSHSH